MSRHGRPLSTPKTLTSILRRLRLDMASPRSATMTSHPWLINSGWAEDVQTAHRKKIGSMPSKNCGPAPSPTDFVRCWRSAAGKFDYPLKPRKPYLLEGGRCVPASTVAGNAGELDCGPRGGQPTARTDQ